ncbi:MAG TPA: bifunctional DNA-formamidopyrimidine glycosylase/DNA-(apurinic or apyrimidinic site) lyase [Pyrinomonadaceae bacterium]|jgi:formamidopyrimidine-DNA glycosylase|nr:bifunctional DNA-formamidopyrimidine glycosylase/DNA-(apurinic or apyrimidinic site) lyase [Pyrinomonadaceae bacterium]
MPELPEVELVARALDRLLRGQRITSARLIRAGLAPDTSPRTFARNLRGAAVESTGRRGKYILLRLDNGLALLTHLRMTGRFLLLPESKPLPRHTHALFHLDDGRRLAFTDQRHFGLMKLARASELEQLKELRGLAPEPFSEEFTPDYLARVLSRSRRALKSVLLDQTKVTGLGNIYASEVLFLARTNPSAVASELPRRRAARLHRAILDVLGEAIAHGSTMNVDPEDIDSSYFGGGHQGRWRVYEREGEPCPSCAVPIRRLTHAGRSTYFCPRCQRP